MGAAKFTFDVEFRKDGDLVSNAARARQRKVFTHEEIDALCAKARAEGMKAGQVRASEAVAAGTDMAVAALRNALQQSQSDLESVRADAAKLALAAARALSRAAVAALPEIEVELALRQSLHQAMGEPRITLRAAPAVVETLKARIAEIAQHEGFEGHIHLAAEAGLSGADCRIEWRGGGADRSTAALEEAVGALVSRHFSRADHPDTEE